MPTWTMDALRRSTVDGTSQLHRQKVGLNVGLGYKLDAVEEGLFGLAIWGVLETQAVPICGHCGHRVGQNCRTSAIAENNAEDGMYSPCLHCFEEVDGLGNGLDIHIEYHLKGVSAAQGGG